MNAAELIANKAEVPGQFDKIARRYDVATFLSQGYAEDLRTSVARMQLRGDELLADLCCGTGKSTRACLEHLPHGRVIAIDNSEGMLQRARQSLTDYIPQQLELARQDVMALDYPDHHFDAIFMAYGIRNMPDARACLHNLHRMLKPGGVVCFHEFSLVPHVLARFYWRVLGYGLIVPFSGLLTGDFAIFRYLIRSVLAFPAPPAFVDMLHTAGFVEARALPLKSWRRPILHTFLARKPAA